MLGPVFRAHDPVADRLVAIKVFRLDATPEQARDLAAGLDAICARLPRHPCLVAALAAGLEGSAAWLAEDYVAADALDARLKRRSAGGLRSVLPVLFQIGEALDAAAEAGMHHGALHPRDVLVSTRLEARVTGLGITEALDALGLAAPVRRPYTAPERAAGAAWRRQADIFSLGVLAFEMLTGRRPVGHGATAAGLVSGVGEGVDADACRQALGRALSERAVDRFERARDFIDALAATLKEPVDLRLPRQREEIPAPPLLATLDDTPRSEPEAEEAPPADAVVHVQAAEPSRDASRPERIRGARPAPRASAPPAAPIITFDAEPGADTKAGLAARAPDEHAAALPSDHRSPLSWDDASAPDVPDVGIETAVAWPANWWRVFTARPGPLAAALVAGVVLGLTGGYVLWGVRAPAAAPAARGERVPPAAVETAAPVRQPVTEPEVKAGAELRPAPKVAEPPVPREAERQSPETGAPARRAPSARAESAPARPARPPAAPPAPRRAAPPPARPSPVASGVLDIASRPAGVRVLIDGRPVGRTPLRLDRIAPGRHTVRLEMDGYTHWETSVTVTAGEAARVAGSLERVNR